MGKINKVTNIEVLQFKLQEMYGCIELRYVSKVILLPLLKSVPDSQPYLAGLLNYAGINIPVIDLGIYLNMQERNRYTLETPIVMCSSNNQQMGLIVDKITGLHMVSKNKIQMTREFKGKNSILTGTVILSDQTTYWVNVVGLLNKNLILPTSMSVAEENTTKSW